MSSYFRTFSGSLTANGQTTAPIELLDGGFVIYFTPAVITGSDSLTATVQIELAPSLSDTFLPSFGAVPIVVPDGGVFVQDFVPVVCQKMRLKVISYTRQVNFEISY